MAKQEEEEVDWSKVDKTVHAEIDKRLQSYINAVEFLTKVAHFCYLY